MARRAVLQKTAATYDGLLYAVVDAAADEHLHDALLAEPPQSGITCLYDGMPAARYARYAPYLLRVHAGSPDRKSTRLNSSHLVISYAVFCLKKKNTTTAVACASRYASMRRV